MRLSSTFYENNNNCVLEICLILFKHCNLHCDFCFQSQKANEIDVNYIKQIPANIAEQLPNILKTTKCTTVLYRIWGGEVFSDFIDDELFNIYEELLVSLEKVGLQNNVKTQFCFSSNLVFEKLDRVKNILKHNVQLATSYDPIGRFKTAKQLEVWKKNVQIFKPSCVSITLTKQNIAKYVTEPIHFQLLKDLNVYIEYYIYCRTYKTFAPSQDELFQFYKYCIDNNITNIAEIECIKNKVLGRYCTCNCSCYYKDSKLSFDCISRSSDLPLSEFNIHDNTPTGRITSLLNNSLCLYCKHFKYCRMYCIASMLHKDYNNKDCALARTYEYVEHCKDR